MDWKLPLSPAVRRMIITAVVLTLSLMWLGDIQVLRTTPAPRTATDWLPVFVTGPLLTIMLPSTRFSPALPVRAVAAAGVSTVLTCVCLVVPQTSTDFGFLEACALLFLIVRVLAQTRAARTAVQLCVALIAAALLMPLRSRTLDTFVSGSYLLTTVFSLGVATGCAIRALELRRQRAVHDVRQAERLALARDLHDLIAHHMTGIIVQANAARAVHATAPQKVDPALEAIARAGTETLESMRRLVRVLREDDHQALRPGDLLAELAELVAAFSEQQPQAPAARLEATAAARTSQYSPEVETSVHRVVREALTNVHRHAPGERVTVRLDADPDWLYVTVVNGLGQRRAGAPAGGRSGFGLIGLKERVEALDGTFRAGPTGDGRWEVRAGLPRTTATRARPAR
ncbi:histidine kinase [Streptomyces sp. NPDC046939]|uniref:sensor histidine kinase n=1 Tax=Streptomyces sp. NPDC046939 TaxID=3155376 RepID=UPI0033C1D2F5